MSGQPDGQQVRPFRLGFMTHVRGSLGSRQTLRHLIELFVVADELGIDGGFVAEHHLAGSEGGQLPSPLVALAAVAEHTTRIDLGTAAIVLPIMDPVRVAEDASVLDALSGGRLQLGLGTGGANLGRYPAFGRSAEESSRLYFENLEVLLEALADGPVRGTANKLTPQACGLAPRIWGAHGSTSSARSAARHGTGLLFGTADLDARAQQLPVIEAYLDEWETSGPDAAPAAFRPVLTPRLGAIRMVYPAPDRATAQAELAGSFASMASRVAAAHGGQAGRLSFDDVVAGLNMHVGHPDEVAQSLAADPALLGHVGYFLAVIDVLAQDHSRPALDQLIGGLDVLATQVAPQLGWKPRALKHEAVV
jgi:alkanesulfonate monooxygenase SsuD/methylene tetrahydromethanopterin reductase-like flavin-dependent oxidoreductase (luciferase family)